MNLPKEGRLQPSAVVTLPCDYESLWRILERLVVVIMLPTQRSPLPEL